MKILKTKERHEEREETEEKEKEGKDLVEGLKVLVLRKLVEKEPTFLLSGQEEGVALEEKEEGLKDLGQVLEGGLGG